MTLLLGLIDCHDHLSSFTYDLMGRWGFAEPRSLRHLRIAKVMDDTLLTGYTTIQDCGWLDVGFKLAVEQGLRRSSLIGGHIAPVAYPRDVR